MLLLATVHVDLVPHLQYLRQLLYIDLVAVTSSMCVKYHTSDNSDVCLLLLFQYNYVLCLFILRISLHDVII